MDAEITFEICLVIAVRTAFWMNKSLLDTFLHIRVYSTLMSTTFDIKIIIIDFAEVYWQCTCQWNVMAKSKSIWFSCENLIIVAQRAKITNRWFLQILFLMLFVLVCVRINVFWSLANLLIHNNSNDNKDKNQIAIWSNAARVLLSQTESFIPKFVTTKQRYAVPAFISSLSSLNHA